MKVTANGVVFDNYRGASPGFPYSAFRDHDGATLLIDTATLVRMYDLCKFDLERRGLWDEVVCRSSPPEITQ